MRNYDFSPLYRSAIGFDHLASLLNAANQPAQQTSFPPYNIELVADDNYRITMAVAGFKQSEIDIEVENNSLTVRGQKEVDQERKYLHQGIAARNFSRKFELANHIRVTNASIEDGLLHVELQREIPEAMKPRKISIDTGSERQASMLESRSKAA